MPRHEPQSDDAIEVQSVLMRLYHSRQMGEAFYPAAFVNGHAPQMEANGWIEWCGQGWRLTDAGLKVWAKMNPSLITRKFQYNVQFFEEMRHVLRGEAEVTEKICIEEGCTNPRFVTGKGEEHSRCEMHQRAKWNREAKAKREKKANQPPPQPSPASDGGSQEEVHPTSVSFFNTDPETVKRLIPKVEARVNDLRGEPEHDCESCEAKKVIEALKAKSPKLAALIAAMEAEAKAASELGL